MKLRTVLIPAVLFALSAVTQAGVGDGSYWTDGHGTTATVDVTDTGGTGVDVTVTDSSGFSNPVTGAEGSDSSANHPTCSNSQNIHTPGNEYDIRNGKLWMKNSSGKWICMRKVKKPKGSQGTQRGSASGPGDNVGTLP